MGSHVPGLLGYRCSRLHTEATSARRWHRATCSWLAATHTDNVIHARERGSGERWWGGTRYGHAHHRRSTGQRGMRHHAESASPSPQGTLTPLSTSPGHHRLEFQQVLPMFPVYSVTDVPGCTEPAACSTAKLATFVPGVKAPSASSRKRRAGNTPTSRTAIEVHFVGAFPQNAFANSRSERLRVRRHFLPNFGIEKPFNLQPAFLQYTP